jgi:hypothetical protein
MLAHILGADMLYNGYKEKFINKLTQLLKFDFCKFYSKNFQEFYFDMGYEPNNKIKNRANVICNVIDFFVETNKIDDFFSQYSRNPFILISSLEAYNTIQYIISHYLFQTNSKLTAIQGFLKYMMLLCLAGKIKF